MPVAKNKKPRTRLSFQERGFVHEYCFGEKRGNAKAAVIKNYNVNGGDSASALATTIMKRPVVLEHIEKLLKKHGLTDDKIFEKIEEGLEATIPASYKGRVFKTDVPDYNARHKYLQDTLKIGNFYPPERRETKTLNVDLQVEKMPKEEMRALLSGLMKKLHDKSE